MDPVLFASLGLASLMAAEGLLAPAKAHALARLPIAHAPPGHQLFPNSFVD